MFKRVLCVITRFFISEVTFGRNHRCKIYFVACQSTVIPYKLKNPGNHFSYCWYVSHKVFKFLGAMEWCFQTVLHNWRMFIKGWVLVACTGLCPFLGWKELRKVGVLTNCVFWRVLHSTGGINTSPTPPPLINLTVKY